MNLLIGIDPGTKTGLAVWVSNISQFIHVGTHGIIEAMRIVKEFETEKFVIVEDARKVKFKTDPDKAQGAGSVKRDCSIWEEFLVHNQIPHKFVRPNPSLTKWDDKRFRAATGIEGRTSQHARDAAMLVFGKKFPKLGSGVT